jgi:hypothetical protein
MPVAVTPGVDSGQVQNMWVLGTYKRDAENKLDTGKTTDVLINYASIIFHELIGGPEKGLPFNILFSTI